MNKVFVSYFYQTEKSSGFGRAVLEYDKSISSTADLNILTGAIRKDAKHFKNIVIINFRRMEKEQDDE